MLISTDGKITLSSTLLTDSDIRKYAYKDYNCFFHGLIFCRGLRSGEESIQFIIDKFVDSGNIPFASIYGAFIIVLENKLDHTLIFFTDNSKMRSFYLGDNFVSNNFLEMVRFEKHLSFDKNNLFEYLCLGTNHFGNTLLNGIKLSDSEHYYSIIKGKVLSIQKKIGALDSTSLVSNMHEFFHDLVFAIHGENISVDLTGGYDSRLVFSEIKKFTADINLFTSGFENSADVAIAKTIAKSTEKEIDIYTPIKPIIDEEYLWRLFNHSQSFSSLQSSIRINGFMKERKNRGFSIRITGDGGVLHKDWWWIQDFPLYNKKYIDLNRFYHQRIYLTKIDKDIFSMGSQNSIQQVQKDFTAQIRKYSRHTNTQTYDMLYYYVSGSKRSPSYNIFSNYLTTYAPLWELDLARISYSLPRKKRFYANYIRELITESAPEISRIRTVYGMNSSARAFDKITDSIYFIKDFFNKAKRVFNRKIFNKNVVSDVDIYNPYNDIKSLDIFNDAVKYFRNLNILRDNVEAKEISDVLVDRILLVYMLYIYSGKMITYNYTKTDTSSAK